jgi:hypothetical protein
MKVKLYSSPTAKIEYVSKFIQKIMPDTSMQEADWMVGLMVISCVALGTKASDLLLEIRYIKAFSQDDLVDKHDACQCLAHIEVALDRLMSGNLDFNQGQNSDS